ncbi:MAG: hypothetical protein VW268_08030 [Rhodospirillaceae bacterium]
MAIAPDHPLPPAGAINAPNNSRGLMFMLAAATIVSCMHVLVRDVAQEIHPFMVVFFRNLVALLVLALPLLR